MRGGYLIREARLRAGITQSELARRLHTSQSLVARWENETVSPLFETVVRAVRGCGLELGVGLFTYDSDHDILIEDQLRLSPDERARRAAEFELTMRELVRSARPVP
jgi:hypothetical protein